MITIEKVENGYILTEGDYRPKEVVTTTDALFGKLLLILEGRSSRFSGDGFGRVEICRSKESELYVSTADNTYVVQAGERLEDRVARLEAALHITRVER